MHALTDTDRLQRPPAQPPVAHPPQATPEACPEDAHARSSAPDRGYSHRRPVTGLKGRIHHLVERLGQLPGLLQWRRRRFDRRFESNHAIGASRGLYHSYEAAAAAAPAAWLVGYDNAPSADLYRERLESTYPSDYAVMVWLQNAFAGGARRVFDLGGHLGVAYYAFQRCMAFPEGLSWTVHDVPAVMQAGEREAAHRDPARRLTFAPRFDALADADVLFSSGCIQFLDYALPEALAGLARKPRWLLLNLLPLHDEEEYWTVMSIGAAYCPYRIQQHDRFFAQLEALGYELQDKWVNLEKECWIAFEPEHSLDVYFGAALRLRED